MVGLAAAYRIRLVVAVDVGLLWHQRLQITLAQLLLERLPHERILVRELDLVLEPVLDRLGPALELNGRVKGEIACRF